MKNRRHLVEEISTEDSPAEVYDKLQGATVKEIVVYIHYLHSSINSYNTALNQLKIHLPKTAKK